MKRLVLLLPVFVIITACSIGKPKEIADTEEILPKMDCDKLADETQKTLHNIADFLHKDSIDQLKKRLNSGVLESRKSLKEEMDLVRLHSCTDVKFDDKVTGQRMETYLRLLEYEYTMMQDKKEMKMEHLTFSESNFPFLYKLRAELADGKQAAITFYLGPDAYGDYLADNRSKPEESLDNTPSPSMSVTADVLKWTTHILDPVNSAASQLKDYYQGKEEREWGKEYNDAMVLVGRFEMEFARIEGGDDTILYDSKRKKVKLYPTDATYDIFDRLKEVHNINPEIPYPEGMIRQEEWKELGDYLSEVPLTIELYQYVFSGTPPMGKSLESIAKNGLREVE